MYKKLLPFSIIILLLASILFCSAVNNLIPVTGEAPSEDILRPAVLPALSSFVSSVKNGQAALLSGVYVSGVMAFPVLQQPAADAGFVSTQPNTITQFRMAGQFNSIGLLAHDYLAGTAFPTMEKGSDIALIYGDGSMKYYRVFEVLRYQALSPASPYSNFVDLNTKKLLSAEQLFLNIYGRGGSTLVFQTCISTAQVPSWGRLFILAKPIEPDSPSLLQALPLIERALAGASRSLSAIGLSLASR
jgi:hypothetical protein